MRRGGSPWEPALSPLTAPTAPAQFSNRARGDAMGSPVLIVGSVAFDSVETPFGRAERVIGGAGTYSATAASLLAPVRLVAVIGDDFPPQAIAELNARGVDTEGVQRIPGGKSFYWSGRYEYDMSAAITLDTQLNVFADFNPVLPESYRDSKYVFLANIQPDLQLSVLDQVRAPKFVMCDTMNFWITGARDALLKVLARVDLALLNDAEVRQLTGTPNLTRAALEVLDLGPRYVVVKKGEYGASLVSREGQFSLPCYPLPDVVDPTGAGDSFAGGFIGLLAWLDTTSPKALRQALACGTVCASACVQDFSLAGLQRLTVQELYRRYEQLREMTEFRSLPPG
jgi:sugar/nucleoside kinase (ribokinase family)